MSETPGRSFQFRPTGPHLRGPCYIVSRARQKKNSNLGEGSSFAYFVKDSYEGGKGHVCLGFPGLYTADGTKAWPQWDGWGGHHQG